MKPHKNLTAIINETWTLGFVLIFLAFGQTLYSQTQPVTDIPAISLSLQSAAVTQQPQVARRLPNEFPHRYHLEWALWRWAG
jgi:hypothetical protein